MEESNRENNKDHISQSRGSALGSGGIEDVGGGIEFGGDVEGVGGEEVDDDGGEGVCGGEGVEGLAEGREGEEDGVGDQGFNFGARWKVGEIDRREEGVGFKHLSPFLLASDWS